VSLVREKPYLAAAVGTLASLLLLVCSRPQAAAAGVLCAVLLCCCAAVVCAGAGCAGLCHEHAAGFFLIRTRLGKEFPILLR
jgi:hypothetical protein